MTVTIERVRLSDLMSRVRDVEHEVERMKASRDSWRQRFGEESARQRKLAGIGLRQMARALGVSAQMLSDFEHGRRWSSSIAFEMLSAFDHTRA